MRRSGATSLDLRCRARTSSYPSRGAISGMAETREGLCRGCQGLLVLDGERVLELQRRVVDVDVRERTAARTTDRAESPHPLVGGVLHELVHIQVEGNLVVQGEGLYGVLQGQRNELVHTCFEHCPIG